MTGRINWPCPDCRFEAPPSCEWINGEGHRIWLPAQYADVVVQDEGGAERPALGFSAWWWSLLLGIVVSWSWRPFLSAAYIAFLYVQLAADVV
jgi:hypothetical protein